MGYLKEFMVDPRNQEAGQGTWPHGNPFPAPLVVIEVIHVAPRGTQTFSRREILAVVSVEGCTSDQPPEKS